MAIPSDISTILESISDDKDKARLSSYIETLQNVITSLGGTLPEQDDEEPTKMETEESTPAKDSNNEEGEDEEDMPPLYVSGEDYDAAGNFKQQAADAKGSGDYNKALEYYNQAVQAAPPSALLYANRAICLDKLERTKAALRDCDLALQSNPDSAKALKTRGKLYYRQQEWTKALSDLSQAQSIDFDPDLVDMLKELSKRRVEQEQKEAQERIAEEEKLKKRAAEIKKAQQQAKEEEEKAKQQQQRSAPGGGMPGMGGMGGMPGGMPGGMGGNNMGGLMEMLMSDPELQEAMKNPKVVAAFSEIMNAPGGPMGLMSNPAKMQELMADPDVGPVLQKLMGKFMGGGGGMPGGMGGMPGGMGGMGGMPPGGMGGGGDADGIPDLGDLPDLD